MEIVKISTCHDHISDYDRMMMIVQGQVKGHNVLVQRRKNRMVVYLSVLKQLTLSKNGMKPGINSLVNSVDLA